MLFGLSLGLVVAAAVYVSDRRGNVQTATPTPVQAAQQQRREEPAPEISALPHPATRFDFYDILPNEVVIPEVESQAGPVRTTTSVEEPDSVEDPDSYVLQTGSFRIPEDAERMRANLATLGIESRVQKVTIDNTDFHRVRIGPMNDLDALTGVRRRLWDAEMEVLLIKVSD
jgi:cell division protein FtsN